MTVSVSDIEGCIMTSNMMSCREREVSTMVADVVSAVSEYDQRSGAANEVAPVMIAITACETRRHFYS